MTPTVTEVTRRFIQSHTYATVSTTVGAIAVVLLIVLLAQKELMRAHGGPRARVAAEVSTIPIAALLLTFVVIVVLRFGANYHPQPARSHNAPGSGRDADALVQVALAETPTVLVDPRAIRFSRQHVHTSSTAATVRVVNLGMTPLSISAVITGPNPHDFTMHSTCGVTPLRAYSGCALTIRFTPQRPGTRHASLVIRYTATGRARREPPSGEGTGSGKRRGLLPNRFEYR